MKKIRFVKTKDNKILIQVKTLFGWSYFRLIESINSEGLGHGKLQLYKSKKDALQKFKKHHDLNHVILYPTIKFM